LEGAAGLGMNTVKVPTLNNLGVWGSTTYTINGIKSGTSGDVVGYVKNNNYRAFGDILNLQRDLNLAGTTGTLKAGVWFESISNDRKQEYIDYTTGALFPTLTATAAGVTTPTTASQSYKLLLNSQITNIQPFIEYEWHPTKDWTITPGYKYESFSRNHLAAVNQTTLQPADFQKTYTASLPFLSTNYRLTDNWSIYGQASKGFLAPTVSAYYVYDSAFNNNTMAPQSTTNYQFGTVYKTEDLTVSADVYRITATNFPLVTTVNGLSTYTNNGTAQYQGFELEGTYKVINNFAAYGSGSLISAKYVEGASKGLKVGEAPSYTMAGGLIYDDQTYFASVIHRVYGSYYGSSGQVLADASVPTANVSLNKVDGWSSTDIVAGIRTDVLKKAGFGEKAQLKVGVGNLFNHRDITGISGSPAKVTDANWAASSLSYSFQAGRTFYVSAKVDF
jgi:iron complex outermembrane receptor protein